MKYWDCQDGAEISVQADILIDLINGIDIIC